MVGCGQARKLLEALTETGPGNDGERRRLLEHAETCPTCRELRDLHYQLESLEAPEPAKSDLSAVRRQVLRQVGSERLPQADGAHGRPAGAPTRRFLSGWQPSPAVAVLALVLVFGVGFFAGRSATNETTDSDPGAGAILDQIERAALISKSSTAAAERPFLYSNVRLQELDAATVGLSFDVTARLELVREKDDPLVGEILVQSLLNREPIGTRLAAIETAGPLEPSLRDALIQSMLNDESLAVRLKALSKLTGDSEVDDVDERVREALLDVLRHDDSVRMRLLAVEHLARFRVAPEALESAFAAGRPEPGTALTVKVDEYLRTF